MAVMISLRVRRSLGGSYYAPLTSLGHETFQRRATALRAGAIPVARLRGLAMRTPRQYTRRSPVAARGSLLRLMITTYHMREKNAGKFD